MTVEVMKAKVVSRRKRILSMISTSTGLPIISNISYSRISSTAYKQIKVAVNLMVGVFVMIKVLQYRAEYPQ